MGPMINLNEVDWESDFGNLVTEALNRKYSDDVVHVLPLENGQFALFNAERKLASICYADEVMVEILKIEKPAPPPKPTPRPPAVSVRIEDLI